MKEINHFRGEYDFLSNFYYAEVEFEGINYPTNEHAFQAAKTFDSEIRKSFSTDCPTPAIAKRKGRHVKLRSDWESVKVDIMTTIVRNKFKAHPDLKKKLLETGTAKLIEGNTWHDTFWGVNINTGKGENHLGKILMQVRSELKNGVTNTQGSSIDIQNTNTQSINTKPIEKTPKKRKYQNYQINRIQ